MFNITRIAWIVGVRHRSRNGQNDNNKIQTTLYINKYRNRRDVTYWYSLDDPPEIKFKDI